MAMDKDETFFENTVDRTNYSGCSKVAIIVVLTFCIGIYGLVSLASWNKRHDWLSYFHFSPKTSMPTPDTGSLLDEIKTSISGAAQKQVDKASQAAQDEIKNQIQQQSQQIQGNITNSVKNSIKP
jgi:hypothetical protein